MVTAYTKNELEKFARKLAIVTLNKGGLRESNHDHSYWRGRYDAMVDSFRLMTGKSCYAYAYVNPYTGEGRCTVHVVWYRYDFDLSEL